MLKDVLTLALAPAGILLGWWLNQRSTRNTVTRAEQRADEAEERRRVLEALRLGRDAAGLIRSLLHAIHIKNQHNGRSPVGFSDAVAEFNKAKDAYRNAVLALRVLGPTWAVEHGETLDVEINKLSELALLMQKGQKKQYTESANADLPELDRLLASYVTTVSDHYNNLSHGLPEHRLMDDVGRWKPLDER